MGLGESPASRELPENLKRKAGEALAYLKELAGEFLDTPALGGNLVWLIEKCNTAGIEVSLDKLPQTTERARQKQAQYPVYTSLQQFTDDLADHVRTNELHPPEHQDLYDLLQGLRITLGNVKYKLRD